MGTNLAHVRDAIARVLSIVRSECGARARNDTLRTRAVPGIMRSATTSGPWGATTGLGQVGAGNARSNCVRCCLRKEGRYRSALRPRPRKPGLEPRATGESPCVRTAVERRQASASARCAAVPAARQVGAGVCRRSASLSFFRHSQVS